jgi:hypothetical protein
MWWKDSLVLGLAMGMLGCGVTTPNPKRMIDRSKVENDLTQIGLAYIMCSNDNPPRKIEDLMPYLDNNAKIEKLLRDGQVVVIWGVRPGQLQDSGGSILAYEKDADDQGTRYVLMADMKTVKAMSDAEFQKAPKAKGNP